MGVNNRYVVLYWTRGLMPTPAQVEEARHFGPHVMFRNASFHHVGSGLEPCTAVAGDVPSDYSRRYPKAVSYIDWLQGKLPVVEAPPEPGQPPATTVKQGSFASRVLDPDAPTMTRAEKQAAAAAAGAADGSRPMDGMTGQDSSFSLPPPPPAAGRSVTADVMLPPPPPPE